MPRHSVEEAQRTRRRIISEAVQQMSVLGAEGTSLAGLSRALGMSKPGVVGPFRSREVLLLEAFDVAVDVFRDRVIGPAFEPDVSPGADRLGILISSWVSYLVEPPFRGGCVLTSASTELDGRPGPLRTRVVQVARDWRGFLLRQLDDAHAAGHSPPGDHGEIVLTLVGLAMALNQSVQLLDDSSSSNDVARLMRSAVGIE